MWCRFISKAILSLVPTPSTLLTRTGSEILLLVDGEQAAEAANVAENTFVEGTVRQVFNALLGPVGALNVYTGVGVGNGLVRCYLFSQVYRSVYRSGKFEKNDYFNIAG